MRQRFYKILGLGVWAATCVLALVCYWRFWSVNQLDADMASEQVLANLLAQQPGFAILSDSWYYSTELRVLNTQLVMMPLFRLFADWHTVRTLGSIILVAIYLAAYYFFARRAGLKYCGLFGMALLLLPFGALYRQYVLQGLYYIPHIAINFFALGCVLWAVQAAGAKSRPRCMAAALLLCAASFAAGLGGPRQIAILQIPLTLAVLLLAWLDRDKPKAATNPIACIQGAYRQLLALALASDAFGVAGYALNACVLSKYYHFQDQSYVSYGNFVFERLQWLLNGVLAAFGWQHASVFSAASVFNFVALLLIVFSFGFSLKLVRGRDAYPLKHRLIGAFFLAMAFSFLFLYCFTDIGHSERYLLPLAVLFIPLLEIYLANTAPQQRRGAAVLAVALAAMLTIRGGSEYAAAAAETNSNMAVAEYLVQNGYTQGYASFWDGNILTELTNGQLEIWTLAQNNEFELRRWLQKTSHLDTDPDGKVFFVVSRWEADGERQPLAQGIADDMPQQNLVYEDDAHAVYAFESAAEMKAACGFAG